MKTVYFLVAFLVAGVSWNASTKYRDFKDYVNRKDKMMKIIESQKKQLSQLNHDILQREDRVKELQEEIKKYQVENGKFKRKLNKLSSTDNEKLNEYERLYKECIIRIVPSDFY